MKTTIEIEDELFERAQRLARNEKVTLGSLTEQGLRLVLKEKEREQKHLRPLLTVPGEGLTKEFKESSWSHLRDEIYAREVK